MKMKLNITAISEIFVNCKELLPIKGTGLTLPLTTIFLETSKILEDYKEKISILNNKFLILDEDKKPIMYATYSLPNKFGDLVQYYKKDGFGNFIISDGKGEKSSMVDNSSEYLEEKKNFEEFLYSLDIPIIKKTSIEKFFEADGILDGVNVIPFIKHKILI